MSNTGTHTTGPLGIQVSSEDGWEWDYYFKNNVELTAGQSEFLNISIIFANHLREFSDRDNALETMNRLRNMFSAVLVQYHSGDLKARIQELIGLRGEYFRKTLTPKYHGRLVGPILLSVAGIIICLILYAFSERISMVVQGKLASDLIVAFSLVMAGSLIGRIVYYGISFSEEIRSLDRFHFLMHETRKPGLIVFFDIVVSFVACLFFIEGFIVIAFGGLDDGAGVTNAVVSSLKIRDDPLLALGFGVVVGVMKTEFLKKLKSVIGTTFR